MQSALVLSVSMVISFAASVSPSGVEYTAPLAWVQKATDETVPSALERAPDGWTDLLAKAGPKLEGWAARAAAGAGKASSRLAVVSGCGNRISGLPGGRRPRVASLERGAR